MPDVIARREVLLTGAAALAAGALAACSPSSSSGIGPEPAPTGADDPDLALRQTVVAAEGSLIAAYDAVIAAHPSLSGRLAPFRRQHAEHRATLDVGGSVTVPPAPPPSVPASASAALELLADLERAAAGARAADAGKAARWELARELCLVGGCEAAHHALLAGS